MASKRLPERDRDGQYPAYAFPGGYPLFYSAADGTTYCPSCASQVDADPPIVDYDINYEDAGLYCDGCSARIESAYAEPEDEPDEPDPDPPVTPITHTCDQEDHLGCTRNQHPEMLRHGACECPCHGR